MQDDDAFDKLQKEGKIDKSGRSIRQTDKRREEIIEAAASGIREYLQTTRGANMCGASAKLVVGHPGIVLELDDCHIYATFLEI